MVFCLCTNKCSSSSSLSGSFTVVGSAAVVFPFSALDVCYDTGLGVISHFGPYKYANIVLAPRGFKGFPSFEILRKSDGWKPSPAGDRADETAPRPRAAINKECQIKFYS